MPLNEAKRPRNKKQKYRDKEAKKEGTAKISHMKKRDHQKPQFGHKAGSRQLRPPRVICYMAEYDLCLCYVICVVLLCLVDLWPLA